MEVLVFGGTSEGRRIVEWLAGRGAVNVVACTATAYGASLLMGGDRVTLLEGPLSPERKRGLVNTHDFACIVDATHPYALHISDSIAELGSSSGLDVVRIVREDPPECDWTGMPDASAAARHLARTTGNILLTTGSKDLMTYAEVLGQDVQRLYVRVLPISSSLALAAEAGIAPGHVIAMQGPFSQELNVALIHEFGIEHLVTKQSGSAGGFEEKVRATRECGVELVVIDRPRKESGYTLEAAEALLEERYGL